MVLLVKVKGTERFAKPRDKSGLNVKDV